LERKAQQLLTSRDVDIDPYDADDTAVIIRWLELVDYKFQVYNISRKFKVSKTTGHIPYLENFPLYLLLQNKDYSPFQVLTAIRRSLNRQAVAGKWNKLNSLVVFKTSNKGYHFFHTIDDFIFIEMPQYQMAFFYFYWLEFNTCGNQVRCDIDAQHIGAEPGFRNGRGAVTAAQVQHFHAFGDAEVRNEGYPVFAEGCGKLGKVAFSP
jgi:hypothetical protein